MYYIKCPSCGSLIGNLQIYYEKKMEEINSDPNITESVKLELQTKLLKSFDLNYCCNMRIKTYKKLTEFIK
jgi:DNA-directed RNA polymerase subunit N (RpoN/RPB10)